MSGERERYLAYMLRLWEVDEVGDDGKPVWWASLESPHTGERQGFVDLEALFDFLEEKTRHQTRQQGQAEEI